jgi:hypothetical protein
MQRWLWRSVRAAGLAILLGSGLLSAEPGCGEDLPARTGTWTGGGGLGFMSQTPDGAAEFGLAGHADYFLSERLSVGPLAQYAGTGNDFLFGLSAQARYWWPLPDSPRTTIVFQGGLGFVRAGITDTDSRTTNNFTSFLIPFGLGLDYALSPRLALTADLLVNVTALGKNERVDGREFDLHSNVMPALYLGLRF